MANTAITSQPQNTTFHLTPALQDKGECPPGLEYLAQIDQIIIKQQMEILELLTGFETNNKYKIFNTVGQQIYFAAEETSCLMRQCCGSGRGFTIHITDNNNQEVMKVVRDFKCCAGCCWCACMSCDGCAFELRIEAPVGQVIGYVRQMQSCWAPNLSVFDENHEMIANLQGPCCVCKSPCCGDVEFPVTGIEQKRPTNQQCAMVSKQWSGFALEMFTDADTFNVRFPQNMSTKVKATLMGAMFLIDFMFFEESNDNNNYG